MKPTSAPFLLAIGMLVGGCDSDRLTQFSTFASAGTQYVQNFHELTTQAGTALIASDSATLIAARNMAGASVVAAHAPEYSTNLQKEDQLIEENLATLQKLDAQATLLGSYFSAITQLTNGSAASQMTTSADALLDPINKFNPQIEAAKVGGQPIKNYVQPSANLIVAHFEVKALDTQLQKASPIIDQALTLQEAAVTAIAAEMKASLGASLETRESTEVIDPYVGGGTLPATWTANRQAFLQDDVAVTGLSSAQQAITELHNDFQKLVENKESTIDFSTLLSRVQQMSTYISAVGSTTSSGAQK
jgi:hypothetical protein